MKNRNTLATGASLKKTDYSGRHRALEMPKGIGYIPLGSRSRVKGREINLVGVAEEIDGADRFESYNK